MFFKESTFEKKVLKSLDLLYSGFIKYDGQMIFLPLETNFKFPDNPLLKRIYFDIAIDPKTGLLVDIIIKRVSIRHNQNQTKYVTLEQYINTINNDELFSKWNENPRELYSYLQMPLNYSDYICSCENIVKKLNQSLDHLVGGDIQFEVLNELKNTCIIKILDRYSERDKVTIQYSERYSENQITFELFISIDAIHDIITVIDGESFDLYLLKIFNSLYKKFISHISNMEQAEEEYPKRVVDFLKIYDQYKLGE